MMIKGLRIGFILLLSFIMLACHNQANTFMVKFYDMNDLLIEEFEYVDSDDLDDLEYPTLESVSGYQFIRWDISHEELMVNVDYEIRPLYARIINHQTDYGYMPRVITNDDYIVLFLMDRFSNLSINSIRIYEKGNTEEYRELLPINRKWFSPEPVFQIYDHKIILPALVGEDEDLAIDIYDLNDPDFYQSLDIYQGDQRQFTEQVYLYVNDALLVETSDINWSSSMTYKHIDIYDLKTYQYQENLLTFQGIQNDQTFYKYYGGGLFTFDENILNGKADYLTYNHQVELYQINDYDDPIILDRPEEINESFRPFIALVQENHLVIQYWINIIGDQMRAAFDIRPKDNLEESIIIQFDEFVKFIEIINHQAIFLGYRAENIYVVDLDTLERQVIEKSDTDQTLTYADSYRFTNRFYVTYSRDIDSDKDDIFRNYFAVMGGDISEQALSSNINGQAGEFLSQTVFFNEKVYALATDQTDLYLMVYLPGQTNPLQAILLEEANPNALHQMTLVGGDLYIYLRDRTFILPLE
jgi:hypothetical protein